MRVYARYQCRTCRATKRLDYDDHNVRNAPQPPSQVVCGFRGCTDYAVPVEEFSRF
jgi:hypothetical protein